jgi:hypothetical protein
VREPSEVCAAIAAEHAANTINAIHQRAARLATGLQIYGNALTDLAEELAQDNQAIGSEKGDK